MNAIRSASIFGHLALGLLVVSSLAACGDSGGGGKKTQDAALDSKGGETGKDAFIPGTPDGPGLDGPTSDIAVLAEAGTADGPKDSPTQLPDAALVDGGLEGPPRFLDAGSLLDASDAKSAEAGGSPNDSPPLLDSAGSGSESGTLDTSAVEAAPAFACTELDPTLPSDVSKRLCFDFGGVDDASKFTPETGTWSVVDGAYHCVGPADGQITCPGGAFTGSGMTTSVLTGLAATDVRVHARLTSWTRPDKVLVLRSRPSGNRIEINFRSLYDAHDGGDLTISALVDCQDITFFSTTPISIPQYPYQSIAVDVELRGPRLRIAVNGAQVYDDVPQALGQDGGTWLLPTDPGSVGFGVFLDGEDVFDDFVVEVLK
jgi:hypothetical protein